MSNQQTSLRDRTDTKIREPQRFKVIIYNDDITTMDCAHSQVGVF